MAQLRTDYTDQILDASVNTQRKYRQVDNSDGTISLEDVTIYSQQGDSFGAGDVNAITGNLTADNGTSFDFAYDAETDQYGYVVNGEFKSFSNATMLYQALQYSGLVTEDMTFEEMCEVLAEEYPAIYKLYMSSANEGGFEAYAGASTNVSVIPTSKPSVTFGDAMTVSAIGNLKGSVVSKLVDVTGYSELKFHHVSTTTNGSDSEWASVYLTSAKGALMTAVSYTTLISLATSKSGDVTIDISNLQGEYYVVVEVGANSSGRTTKTIISNMYME